MSKIYRYCIQQRTPPTDAPDGFIRDVSVPDPSAELVAHNAAGMADVQALALAYGPHVPADYADAANRPYRIIVAEIITDTVNQANNATPIMHAYPYLSRESVDKVLAEFDAEIATSLATAKKRGHGRK